MYGIMPRPTYDGHDVRLYLNGSLEAQHRPAGHPARTHSSCVAGQRADLNRGGGGFVAGILG